MKTDLAAAAGLDPGAAAVRGRSIMGPGNFIKEPGVGSVVRAGADVRHRRLPHILMRFFTVPDARQARKSVLWATGGSAISTC